MVWVAWRKAGSRIRPSPATMRSATPSPISPQHYPAAIQAQADEQGLTSNLAAWFADHQSEIEMPAPKSIRAGGLPYDLG